MDDVMVLHGEYVSYASICLYIRDVIFKLYFISQVFYIVLKFLMSKVSLKFVLFIMDSASTLICSSLFLSFIDVKNSTVLNHKV